MIENAATIPATGPLPKFATAGWLHKNVLPTLVQPPPSLKTLERLLRDSNIPRWKRNPMAICGGGSVYFSTKHVAGMFTAAALPGRLEREGRGQ